MNRLLVGVLDLVNKLMALLIIVSSTIEGYRGDFSGYVAFSDSLPERVVWAVVGLLIGVVVAGIVSGVLAALITIARELIGIRELLSVRVWTAPPPT